MKAWSLLEVKEVSDEQRVIRGMATTPRVDRVGDIVDPMGMYALGNPKLHLYHSHNLPVGSVKFGKPTKAGIPFEAHIPEVKEEGTIRERVNEAWHSVKYKLLDAVSIGFRPDRDEVELMPDGGGLLFKKWEMLELSLVGVPANPDAVISAFKSADAGEIREALGVTKSDDTERESLMRRVRKDPVKLVQIKSAPINDGSVRLIKK